VWDLPTRVFHWLLAICLLGSWATAEAGFDYTELHFLLGYTSLTLILFRIIWGFIGPRHARFSSFLRGPATSITSLKQLFSRQPGADAGHSAIASWSVLALLLLVAAQPPPGCSSAMIFFMQGHITG